MDTKQENKVQCAHEGCDCKFDPAKGVKSDGKVYCSQGCAEGAGCKHEDCACASS